MSELFRRCEIGLQIYVHNSNWNFQCVHADIGRITADVRTLVNTD
jgi:hypothetical protein